MIQSPTALDELTSFWYLFNTVISEALKQENTGYFLQGKPVISKIWGSRLHYPKTNLICHSSGQINCMQINETRVNHSPAMSQVTFDFNKVNVIPGFALQPSYDSSYCFIYLDL